MSKNQTRAHSRTKPIKLLYLVTISEWGGAQKYIFDLVTSLGSSQYHISLAAGGQKNGPLLNKLAKLKIKTYYLANLQRPVNLYRDWLAFLEIVRLYRKVKPDIVHLNSSKAGSLGALAAKCCGLEKVIYTVHGLVLNEPLSAAKKLFYWLAEWLSAKFKTQLICVSNFDRASLLRHKITNSKKITVIHNGIDINNLKLLPPLEAKEKLIKLISFKLQINPLQLQATSPLIGSIANFYPTKGLSYLIEAARELHSTMPQLKFIIIGDGPDRRKLTELISSYKLTDSVFLTGTIPSAAQYLKAFTIFILPSVKEGLSYTLIEAAAAGLPIIATTVGGNPEIISHNVSGILTPPHDFNAIAQNIINLANNQTRQVKLAQNALISSAKFSLNEMARRINIIYQS